MGDRARTNGEEAIIASWALLRLPPFSRLVWWNRFLFNRKWLRKYDVEGDGDSRKGVMLIVSDDRLCSRRARHQRDGIQQADVYSYYSNGAAGWRRIS